MGVKNKVPVCDINEFLLVISGCEGIGFVDWRQGVAMSEFSDEWDVYREFPLGSL